MMRSVIASGVLLLLLSGCSSSTQTKAPYESRVAIPGATPESGKIEPRQPLQLSKPGEVRLREPMQQQAKNPQPTVARPEQPPPQQVDAARQQQAEEIRESVMAKMEENSAAHSFLPDAKLRWKWPVKGRVIKSYRPTDPARRGILIGGTEREKIAAAESGEVVYSDDGLTGYGQLIIIKHNKNYLSIYAYNYKRLVEEGEWVSRGMAIATMGRSSGMTALHFEIRRNGDPQNPLEFLP